MRCLKAFGERIAARDPDRQTAEIQIRVALINRFNALGTAEVVRMARHQPGKGESCLSPELRNNAVRHAPGRLRRPGPDVSSPVRQSVDRGGAERNPEETVNAKDRRAEVRLPL